MKIAVYFRDEKEPIGTAEATGDGPVRFSSEAVRSLSLPDGLKFGGEPLLRRMLARLKGQTHAVEVKE